MDFDKFLAENRACEEAIAWRKGKSLDAVFSAAKEAWIIWVVGHLPLTQRDKYVTVQQTTWMKANSWDEYDRICRSYLRSLFKEKQ